MGGRLGVRMVCNAPAPFVTPSSYVRIEPACEWFETVNRNLSKKTFALKQEIGSRFKNFGRERK